MRNGTQLFQQSRSPLIQGKSRYDHPLWQAWLAAVAVTVLALVAWTSVTPAGRTLLVSSRVLREVPRELLTAALGSAAGVLVAKLFGWRHRWIGGVLAGSSAVALVYLIMLAYATYFRR